MIFTETAPAIRFELRGYRLHFNWALLESLENPRYLQLMFENERKLLAVSGSFEKKKHSFEIPERTYRLDNDECYISRMPLTEAFRHRMDWDKKSSYRVIGDYAAHLGVVVFDLTRARIIGNEV
jgi:hypothetical protein